jgi:hypothetical protein
MKNYLRTIHQRSPAHKKRFALAVSGIITLTIFGLWSMVVLGNQTPMIADNANSVVAVSAPANPPVGGPNAISPFDDISNGVANIFGAIKNQFEQTKQSVGSINVQNKYEEVRNQALTN